MESFIKVKMERQTIKYLVLSLFHLYLTSFIHLKNAYNYLIITFQAEYHIAQSECRIN